MTTALDQFERELVEASRKLHAQAIVAHAPVARSSARRRARVMRRFRQLNTAVQLVLAGSTLSAVVAGGAFLIFGHESAKTIAGYECRLDHNDDAIISSITGDPIVDCAASWGSATGGRSTAPPLAAWAGGSYAAVVQPAAWGPPEGGQWTRLPAGWTVNLGVVELTDQLNDISGLGATPACTFARGDLRLVRALLHADGLRGWRVHVKTNYGHPVSSGCRQTVADVSGADRTVELIQFRQAGPPVATGRSARERRFYAAADRIPSLLAKLDAHVNRLLARRCVSVSVAARLWVAEARVAGFKQANLAYWRALNATQTPSPRLLYYYTLIQQPPTQHTGSCAHILIPFGGGGDITVYAARIMPPLLLKP
ncbi:MAG TPA: hypothetical protein VIX82_04070 [Solirubrobacteraceae bacterium]